MKSIVHVLPAYAALFALFFVVLSVRTLRLRHQLRIAVGDKGDERMLRAMRVHSNFAEYVPITLLLLLMVEMQGGSATMIHGYCIALLAGRMAHAYGVSQVKENFRFRVFGMALTLAILVSSAITLLVDYARG